MADNNGNNNTNPTDEYFKQLEMFHSMQDNYDETTDVMDEYEQLKKSQKRWQYDPSVLAPDPNATPVENYGEYERLGINFKKGSDYTQEQLWKAQSPWEKATNAAYRFGWNTLYDTVGGVGSMLDVFDYYNTDDEVGNFMSEWAAKEKEKTAKVAPIYKPEDAGMGNFAWWMENGSALASSIAAFGLQGMGVGALFKGVGAARMLGKLAKTGRFGKAAMRGADDIAGVAGKIDDVGASAVDKFWTAGRYKKLEQAANGIDNFGATLMLNQAESIMTASEIYNSTYQDAINRGYAPEYARAVAAQSATHSINLNRANIMLNLTSTDMIMKGFGNVKNIKDKITMKSMLKKAGSEGAQEAGEELINLFAEKQGTEYGKQMLDQSDRKNRGKLDGTGISIPTGYKGLIDSYNSIDWSNPFGDATFKEGFETAILGALGGIGQTALVSGVTQGKGAYAINKAGQMVGIDNLLGLMKTQDAIYKENQYYADGSIKHKKGERIVETEDATYEEDQFDDKGNLIHKKGDTIYKTYLDEDGNEQQEAVQKAKLDEKGNPIVLKVGEVDENGNKIEGGKARKFSYNDLYNFRIDEENETLNKVRDQTNKMERIIGGAKIQSQIERTIYGLDNLVNELNTINDEDKDAIYQDLATLELLQDGETEITQEKVDAKKKEYESLNAKQIRKKQDELMDMSLASQALQAFELGTDNLLLDMFKEITKMTPEQAKEKGYGDNYKENAERAIEKVKEYQKMYQEFSFKHSPEVARRLFLNRIKRETLGTEAQILNEEIKDLHDKEYEKFKAENGIEKEMPEDRQKYDQAYELEKQRAKKIKDSKELKKLEKEREELRDEMTKLDNKRKETKDKKELDKIKKEFDELNKKYDDNVNESKELLEKINKPIDEQIKELGLSKESKGVRNQASLHEQRLSHLEKAIKLDAEFDKLRSKKYQDEIKRQALEKYRKGLKNQMFIQYMSEFLKTQKQGGTLLYYLDKDTPVEGTIKYENGKYFFVTKEETITVPEDLLDSFKVKDPLRQAEIDAIVEQIKENNERIEQAIENLKVKSDENVKIITEAENAKSIDELLVPDENHPRKEDRKKYRESLITDKDGNILPLEEAKKKIVDDIKRRFDKANWITVEQEDGTTKSVQKEVYEIQQESQALLDQLENDFNYFNVKKGEEGTEDENINFLVNESIEIPLSFDSLGNMINLDGSENEAYKANRNLTRSLYDRMARIDRAFEESNSLYNKVIEDQENADKLNEEYIKQIALYNQLLLALRTGDIYSDDFKDIPEVAQIKMLQLKMQDMLVSTLNKKLVEAKAKVIDVEDESNRIKDQIEKTNDFINDLKQKIKDNRDKAQEYKDLLKRRKADKTLPKEEYDKLKSFVNRQLAFIKQNINNIKQEVSLANADIKALNFRIKQLNKIAKDKDINKAIQDVEDIKELLSQIGDKGFNPQIFKLISDINSFKSKKKELNDLLKMRKQQKSTLERLFNYYADKVHKDKDIAKTLEKRREVTLERFLDKIYEILDYGTLTDDEKKLVNKVLHEIYNLPSGELLLSNTNVDNAVKALYANNIITESEFKKLINTLTEFKVSSDIQNEIYMSENADYDDMVSISNTIYDYFVNSLKVHEEYDKIKDEIDFIDMEADRLKSVNNSAFILLDSNIMNELFSIDGELITDFDKIVQEINKVQDQIEITKNKLKDQRAENLININKLKVKRERIVQEYNSMRQIRNATIDDLNALYEGTLVDKDNFENEILDEFKLHLSKNKMLLLAKEMEKEIDEINKQIELSKKSLSLIDSLLLEEYERFFPDEAYSHIPESDKLSSFFTIKEKSLYDANKSALSQIINDIRELKRLKEEFEVSVKTIDDIYNRQRKVINEDELIEIEENQDVEEDETESGDQTGNEGETKSSDKKQKEKTEDKLKRIQSEFSNLLNELGTNKDGLNNLLFWFDQLLAGKSKPNNLNFSFKKKDSISGKEIIYVYQGVISSKGKRKMMFEVIEDGELLSKEDSITIEYNDDKNKPNFPSDGFDFLNGTTFIGVTDVKKYDKRKKPKDSLNQDGKLDPSTDVTGHDLEDGRSFDFEPVTFADREIDARKTIFASVGTHIKFDKKENTPILEGDLPVLTQNVYDITWFNTLNKISEDPDYKKKYRVKFISSHDPLLKDKISYTENGPSKKTFGEFPEAPIMVLVDEKGEYVRSESGEIIFNNTPKKKEILTNSQYVYAISNVNKTLDPKKRFSVDPKSRTLESEKLAIKFVEEKLAEFRNKVLESIKNGDEVILPITKISSGHEYQSQNESNENYQNLLEDLRDRKQKINLLFGGSSKLIPEKKTKPNVLYLKHGNSHITLGGQKLNNNDIGLVSYLLGEWSKIADTNNKNIGTVNGLKPEENLFDLINKIIYYDRAKNGKFENFQMLLRNNNLRYKPSDSKTVLSISQDDLISLTNNGRLIDEANMTKEQKDFVKFLQSMRRQIYKKSLNTNSKFSQPMSIDKDGKVQMKTYNNYNDYLTSSESPIVTRTIIPEGTNTPMVGRYLSFDETSVMKDVQPLNGNKNITEEEYEIISEETKGETKIEDPNVGFGNYMLVGKSAWQVESQYKDGNKYSAVYRLFGLIENGDWVFDDSRNEANVNYYENGKLITDENKINEIKSLFNVTNPSSIINELNSKLEKTINIVTVTDKDSLRLNIQANIDANISDAVKLFKDNIESWLEPVKPKITASSKKQITALSWNGALNRMNKVSVFNKYKPLIDLLGFSGKLIMDENEMYAHYNASANNIVIPRQIENATEVDALNILHELTHAGTINWLRNPENQKTDEYKRLVELRNVLLTHVLESIKKPDSYFSKEMGDGFNAMTYILFGGNNFKLDKNSVVELISKYRNGELTSENLIKELSKGMTSPEMGLVELVTFAMFNKEFQEQLNSMKLSEEDKKVLQTKSKNLWQHLLDMIGNIFGIKVKDGHLLKEVLEATADVTQNLDRKLISGQKKVERNKLTEIEKIKINREISLNDDNIETDYDSKNDLYISVGFVIDENGNKIPKRQIQEMQTDKDKHEGLKKLINDYYDALESQKTTSIISTEVNKTEAIKEQKAEIEKRWQQELLFVKPYNQGTTAPTIEDINKFTASFKKDGTVIKVYAATNNKEKLLKEGFSGEHTGLGTTKGESKGTIFLTPFLHTALDYANVYALEDGINLDDIDIVEIELKNGEGSVEGDEIRTRKEHIVSVKSLNIKQDSIEKQKQEINARYKDEIAALESQKTTSTISTEVTETTPTKPIEPAGDIEKQILDTVKQLRTELGLDRTGYEGLRENIKLKLANGEIEAAQNLLNNKNEIIRLFKDLQESPITSSSIVDNQQVIRISRSKDFDSVVNSFTNLFNNFETLNQKDRSNSIKTLLNNVFDYSKLFDLYDKLESKYKEQIDKIATGKKSRYDAYNEIMSSLFEDYLSSDFTNIDKSILPVFDEIARFYSDNVVTNKLQDYRDNYNPLSNLKDSSLVYSPIMDTKITVEGVELTQEESTAIMDGMTSMMFKYIKNQDADVLFEENIDWFEAYKNIRNDLKNELGKLVKVKRDNLNEMLDEVADEFGEDSAEYEAERELQKEGIEKINRLNSIRNSLFLESQGDEQWIKAWKRHADRMRSYGIKYDVDELLGDETETVRDREFNRSQGEENEKDKIPPAVKLWIASRTRSNAERNIFNFPVLFDFNDSYNYIVNKLAGLPADSEIMFEKLKSLRSELLGNDTVDNLSSYKRYRYDLLTSIIDEDSIFERGRSHDASPYEFKLLNQITQTFSKQRPRFYVARMLENGDISFLDSNQNKSSDMLIREWRDEFTSNLVDTEFGKRMTVNKAKNLINVIKEYGKLTEDSWIGSENIPFAIQTKNNLINGLKELGIKFNNFDEFSEKLLLIGGKDIQEVLKYSIQNALQQQVEIAEEKNSIYLREGYNLFTDNYLAGTIKLFAEIESDINQISVNNQFIAANGQTNYGVTLNHYLSTNVNQLNYLINNFNTAEERRNALKKEMPHLFNVFNSYSELLDKIIENGWNIEMSIFNGFSPQSGEGLVLKDLGEGNRWAMLIASTMAKHPIYTFFRAADRTTESGFRIIDKFGTPQNLFRDIISTENHGLNDVASKMNNYLKDELKAMYSFNVLNLGKNILYYKKNGDKFKLFSDDKLILNQHQKDETNLGEKLIEKLNKLKKPKGYDKLSDEQKEIEINKLIDNLLDDEMQSKLFTSYKQYFQRKALGEYYIYDKNDINKIVGVVKAPSSKKAKKDYKNSVKGRLDELGLLRVIPQPTKEKYNPNTGLTEYEAIDREGKYFAGISSEIMNKYLPIGKSSDVDYENALNNLLVDFEALQWGSYVEFGKLLIGDPTMFKTQDDFFKRMSMFNSTKKQSIIDNSFNAVLNTQNGGKLYINHNGSKYDLGIKISREELQNNDIKSLREIYQKQIESKIKSVSFLKDNNYTVENVDLELEQGYKKYFIPGQEQWKNTFTSVIFEDINTISSLSFEDGVKTVTYEDGNIKYYDEDGNDIDVKNIAPLTSLFAESFVKDGITNSLQLSNKVLSYVNSYRGYDEADAQAYITLDGYKEILLRSGDWTIKHHNAYSKIEQGLELNSNELALFPVLKTQYTGPLSNTPGLYVPAGYKHSLFPLVPQFIKNTKLDEVRKFLEDNNITMANMHSANKYGTILNEDGDIMRIYNDEGKFSYDSENKILNGRSLKTQDTDWRWLGVQVDQAPKFKNKITVGSQFRKLVLSNIINQGVPVDYNGKKKWNSLTEKQKLKESELYRLQQEYVDIQSDLIERPFNELIEELDIEVVTDKKDNIVGYTIKNRDALIDIIIESQKDRNIEDNIIVSLNSLRDEQITVEQVLNKEKVEQIIHALINSRIIREKRKGEMSPQVASSLFEYNKSEILLTEGTRLINTKGKEYNAVPSPLKTYRKGFNGKTLPAEAMIALPKEWISFVEKEGGLDEFNDKIDALHQKLYAIEENGEDLSLTPTEENLKKLITIIGFRIPNQGLNSSDFMRIRRFLPTTFGYSVVVPSEMIPKAGSDFDIDKLSVYLPYYINNKKEGPTYTKYMTKENSTDEERYNAFIDSYSLKTDLDEESSSEQIRLKDLNKSFREEIKELKEELEKLSNESYDLYKLNLAEIRNRILKDINTSKDSKLKDLLELSRAIFEGLPTIFKEKYWKFDNSEDDGNNFMEKLLARKLLTETEIDLFISQNKEGEYNEVINRLRDLIKSYDDIMEVIDPANKVIIDELDSYKKIKALEKEAMKIVQEEDNLEYNKKVEEIKSNIENNRNIIKEIIREAKIKQNNLPSLKDFLKLPVIKQNSKEALQNRMIEIHAELISHPFNFRQLMAPISDAVLNDKDTGIVWDNRFIQDTDEIVIEKDGKKISIIPALELLNRKEKILKDLVFHKNGKLKAANIKGYINSNGILVTNENFRIQNKEISLSNVVLNEDAQLVLLGESAKEYQKLRSIWYKNKSAEFKQGTFAQVASSVTNMKKFIEFLSGKTGGVGQTAVHITHHQLGAAVNLSLNNKNPYWIFPHNINEDGYPSFANTHSTDGELISETLSAFLNAYVDVAKDPYIFSINAGSKTANMIFMMLRAGAPIKWIGRFLSQPIIKDYIKAQDANESLPIKNSGLEQSKSELVSSIMSKYGNIENINIYSEKEDYDNKYDLLFEKLRIDDSIENMPAYNPPISDSEKSIWNSYNLLKEADLFSYEKLGEYIMYNQFKEDTDEIPDSLSHNSNYFNATQIAILDLFLEYQRQSKHLQELIRATSADTKGIPQNRAALEIELMTAKKVLISNMWNNAESLINKTIVKQFNEARENTFKMYKPLYLIEKQPLLKRASLELYSIYSPVLKSGKARIKLHDTISNDMIMALMSIGYNNSSVTKNVYETLFIKNQKSKYKNAKGEPISFPQFINELKDSKLSKKDASEFVKTYWKLRDNPFIKKLSGYISANQHSSYKSFTEKGSIRIGKPSVDYLKYINSKGIQEELNSETEALQQIKEEFPEFYNDLVTFSLFQNGFNNSPNSFVNKIPALDINKMKQEAIDNFLALDEEVQKDILSQFVSQFKHRNLRLNPGLNRFTKMREVKNSNDEVVGYAKNRSVRIDETLEIQDEDNNSNFINLSRINKYEFLTAIVKHEESDSYLRVALPGEKNGNYLYFSPSKGSRTYIIGEEMYFTGYDLTVNTPEIARKNNMFNEQIKNRIIEKEVSEMNKETPILNSLPSPSETPTFTYAGIGSRETPSEILTLMTEQAKYLESLGFKLQTGFTFPKKDSNGKIMKDENGNVIDEEGADKAFSDGTSNKILFGPDGIRDYQNGKINKKQYDSKITNVTDSVVNEIHPRPNALGKGGFKLMSRNTNQIFGENLNSIVDFVLFYAKETSNLLRPEGGTGQAVEIARRKGIPTINMADPNWKEQLESVLSGIKEKGNQPTSNVKTYTGKIDSLKPNQIFVFGSNLGTSKGGKPTHGKGNAKIAKDKFGAIQGQPRGLQGQSYGIVTKKYWDVDRSSTEEEIKSEIKSLYDYATQNPDKEFMIAYMGGNNVIGNSGYSNQELANMFSSQPIPSNIVFEEEFSKLLSKSVSSTTDSNVKINIYAGTGENTELSNFANRPFIYNNVYYNNVETAFQHQKLKYADKIEEQPLEVQEMLNRTDLSGKEAKELGRKIKGLNTAAWNKASSKIMKDILLSNFKFNQQYADLLIATGNAELTHMGTEKPNKWTTEFPKLLMEVREEIKDDYYNNFKDVPFSPFTDKAQRNKTVKEAQDIASKWIKDSNCKR